ncbi:aminoacyl tRNA synthase complex-interacting multifunctional protein 1 isoform X2 [Sardina pilchardus]|uniref:aminoacyl tRNA synthase complex-interacting multifunctional protein 1 isoform X2 n=1 Tax=Sardina pilchardus TaxID=27697 RepID=UPI002E147EE6
MSAPGVPPRDDATLSEQEQMMEFFKQKMMLLGEKAMLQKSVREEKKLLVENAKLKGEIDQLKKQLQENQRRKAAKLKVISEAQAACPANTEPAGGTTETPSPSPSPSATPAARDPPRKNKPQGESEGRRRKGTGRKSGAQDSELGIWQLDLRVGRIASARQHPEAESLCVQEVDLGEGQPRTAVSGFLTSAPTEQMSERLCVCVCNGRAVRMKGVLSKVHVLCVADYAHLEMLIPPSSAQPGDRVTFNNYPDLSVCVQVNQIVN